MELIFHIIVEIQHQMHFSELSGFFGGDCQIWLPGRGEPAAAPSASTALCVAGHLQQQRWQQKQPQGPEPVWLIGMLLLVGSTCAYTPGPLPA